MKLQILITSAVLFCYTHTFAQDFKITGTVADENNNLIPYATILLSKGEDNAIVSGTSTNEEGTFVLDNIDEGDYTLTFSYVGYTNMVKEISVSENILLETVVLTPDTEQLEAVTVNGKLPTVKKLADRMVFNVGNTSLTNGSIFGVLQKTPQVLSLNGQLTVKGQAPSIYINNRKVYLSATEVKQLLENTPATSIQSIEVITSPSAKYDAEDAVVVNIVMTKNLITGYNGLVSGSFTEGIYPKYAVGTSHFYKTDKLNVYLSYAYNKKKLDRLTTEFVQFYDEGGKDGYWNSQRDFDTWEDDHTLSTNIDYDISPKSKLHFSANTVFTPYWERNIRSYTQAYNQMGVIDSSFTSLNNTNDKKDNLAFNLGYNLELSDSGQNLSFLVHHTLYNYERDQFVTTDYFNELGIYTRANDFKTIQNQDINIYTWQADYTLPTEKYGKLEAGIKEVFIETESDLEQQSINSNIPLPDLNNNNVFDYTENNLAAYTNYSKEWEKWSLRAGIRSEYTNAEGTAENQDDNNSFNYVKWFPSAGVSYTPSNNHNFSFSYRKSISRPSYNQLNPFRFYLSDNSYVGGNSQLLPEVKHYTSIDYTFLGAYTLSFFYKHLGSPMSELSFQENSTRKVKYVADNLDKEEAYGLDLYVSKSISDRWYLYFESSTFYNKQRFFAVENNNVLVDNNQWTGWIFLGNYFTLLKDNSLLADVTYMHVLPANDGNAKVTTRSNFSISLSKSLWNNRASISLQGNDIFNGQIFTSTTQYLDQYNTYRARFENRTIMVGFKYKFGNYRLKNNSQDIDVEERERL